MTLRRLARITIGGVPRVIDLFHALPTFPHLTVTDYGASTGAADNQTALTSALAAAKAQGLPLFVPPGTWKHSGILTVDSAVLFGVAASSTTLQGTTVDASAVTLTGTNPGLHCLTVTGTGKSPRSANRGGNGVYVNLATGYTIRGCHIMNCPGAGIMVENSSGGLERGNLVELTGADGIYHTEGSHNIEVSYNKTLTTGDDGISFTSYNDAAGYVHDVQVHHNSVLGNFESRAITVNGTSGNVSIYSNHIDGGTSGISCTSVTAWGTLQTAGVEAYGNTIRNINQTRQDTGTIGGGALSFWNDVGGSDSGLSLHDNQIFNPGLYGIYAGGTSPITASVTANAFYLGGTLFHSDNTSATVTQTGNTSAATTAYPGDTVPRTVGGIEPTYRYAPA